MSSTARLFLSVALVTLSLLQLPESAKAVPAVSIKKWPGRLVPYTFSDDLSWLKRRRIKSAIKTFNKRSCVSYAPYDMDDAYVEFGKGIDCINAYGMYFKGVQQVWIFSTERNKKKCAKKESIVRQLLRVAGGDSFGAIDELYGCETAEESSS